jgi:MtrB/PioB family decaheme-associated outer membrane protein
MEANDMARQAPTPLSPTLLATALCAALWAVPAPAVAGADDGGPASTVSVGIADVAENNQRFGQYTGLEANGPHALLDVDLNHLDAATGTWLQLQGRDMGLDTRELRLRHERQGDFGYELEYRRIPRTFPYAINTGLSGVGTASVIRSTITPGTGSPLRLKTERDVFRVALNKDLPAGLDVRMDLRVEEKTGQRLFGRTGIDFLVEPIDYNTRQLETALSYTGERLQLSVGYYGTFFENKNKGLVVDGVTDGNNSTYSPIGLPPDNGAHQLYVSGGYSFTPTTRGNFKASFTKLTQDDGFIPTVTVAPGVGTDLNGKIDTTRLQLGLTGQPARNLSLRSSFRYDDHHDRTPVLTYYTGAGANSRTNGENEPRDIRTTAATVEAGYRLPQSLRLTGGVDYEQVDRNISAVRSVSARDTTRETGFRLGLRRAMTGTSSGALTWVHSMRDGTDFEHNVLNGGGDGANNIAPVHYANRLRDKLHLTLDGMPTGRLSLQFTADMAWDRYDGRTVQDLGVRRGDWKHASLDAAYQLAASWQLTAFASHDRTTADQRSCDGISSSGAPCAATDLWQARLTNRDYAVGVGVQGTPGEKLKLALDVQYGYDRGVFDQAGTPIAAAVPDLYYKQTTVTLSADYALTANAGLGLTATYDRRDTNDWSWPSWQYADGTTVYQDPNEDVTFVGVRYDYTWR